MFYIVITYSFVVFFSRHEDTYKLNGAGYRTYQECMDVGEMVARLVLDRLPSVKYSVNCVERTE